MRQNILKYKGYTHFDFRKTPSKYYDKVKNSKWIKSHGFYPFIHFQIKFKKYVENKENNSKVIKEKERDIYYSSHVDRYIYQYYADILNTKYNTYAKNNGINKVSIAYRKGLKGKCNIHFAKEVFEFIKKTKQSIIIVGDYTSFFDNLDHRYLKEKISAVLGVSKLPDDQYKVFKSITKFSYVELHDIENYKKLDRSKINNLDKYFNTHDFQEFKKSLLYTNSKDFGIPQGSAISAVYSNIYMIDFDKKLNDYVTGKQGIYRRYCDDFIIVLPCEINSLNIVKDEIIQKINNIKNDVPRLILHPEKTEFFRYNCNTQNKINKIAGDGKILNYLGFAFDGDIVKLREKSLFKYYSRAYKKVKTVNRHKNKTDYFAIKKSLYQLYTHLGDKKYRSNKKCKKNKYRYGNFITYARRAHELMSSSELLKSEIRNQIKKHWKKINNRLNNE